MTERNNLPPLPELDLKKEEHWEFTAEQLRAYAEEAIRLEHDRLLNLSEAMIKNDIGAILKACQIKSGLPSKEEK